MIYWLIAKVVLCLAAGLANAGMDTQQQHFSQSVFRFWDQAYFGLSSWKNKYFRPKWIPVQLTDFWHLAKEITLSGVILAVAMPSNFRHWWIDAVFCRIIFWIGFKIGYEGIWLRK